MATKRRTSAQLKAELEARAAEQLEKSLEGVEYRVDEMVARRLNGIVLAALGMEERFGEVSVDHCNGRKTAIANRIGALAMERIGASFDKWLAQACLAGKMPKGWRAAVRKEYEDAIEWQLRDRMKRHVQAIAEAEVERMVAAALADDGRSDAEAA
jgi:hypothetical protein